MADHAFPGAAYAFGTESEAFFGFAGSLDYSPDSPLVARETIYDLASLTKVVATTSAAMLLEEDGLLQIDRPVSDYLPGCMVGLGFTVRNLLLHNSGLIWHRNLWEIRDSGEEAWAKIVDEPLEYETGSRTEYSCIGFILLSRLIGSVLAPDAKGTEWLEEYRRFLKERWFDRLDMRSTGFLPSPNVRHLIAPTETNTPYRPDRLPGEVHDENAHFLGGVSGNAGLFGTVDDLAKFAQAMLCEANGLVARARWRRWTRRAAPDSTRALGWDTKSPTGSSAGRRFTRRSFGHTGFTGTSIWIDPTSGRWAVLLTNRVHPTRNNILIQQVRPQFHDAVASALI